jgi:dolichol kinase
MSIGVAAVLARDAWTFAAAMLVMGVADGFAALAGTLIHGRRYRVFGHTKSYHGTSVFFVCTLLILILCAIPGNFPLSLAGFILLPLVATVFENLSVAGTDNLFVPLLVLLGIGLF